MPTYVLVFVLFMWLVRIMETPTNTVMAMIYGFLIYFMFVSGISIAHAANKLMRGD